MMSFGEAIKLALKLCVKKASIIICFLLTFVSIACLYYRDYLCKKPMQIKESQIMELENLLTWIENNKEKSSFQPISANTAGFISSEHSKKHPFSKATIIEKEEFEKLFKESAPNMPVEAKKIWFYNDNTIGFLLKSSGGIGFFRDYYHELVYDPHNKIKTGQLNKYGYSSIFVQEHAENWKYRITASPWD